MNAQKKQRRIDPGFKLFLITLPVIILYFLFCYLPLEGWKYALFNYKPGFALQDCEFVGLKHFTTMFANRVVRRETLRVLRNTMVMSTIGIATSFLPMAFAIFLNEIPWGRYRKFIQTATTLPNFIGWVIVYGLATALFAPQSGAVNVLLKEWGVIEQSIDILATEDNVWLLMWAISNWKGLGWGAVLYLSALNSADQELYEAAAIDGAGRFQKMWYISVPALMPTFITLMILSIGNFLNTGMENYYVFQNSFNKSKIEVLDLYVYNQGLSSRGQVSYATAVGIWKSVVGLILLFVSNALSGKVRGEKIF